MKERRPSIIPIERDLDDGLGFEPVNVLLSFCLQGFDVHMCDRDLEGEETGFELSETIYVLIRDLGGNWSLEDGTEVQVNEALRKE